MVKKFYILGLFFVLSFVLNKASAQTVDECGQAVLDPDEDECDGICPIACYSFIPIDDYGYDCAFRNNNGYSGVASITPTEGINNVNSTSFRKLDEVCLGDDYSYLVPSGEGLISPTQSFPNSVKNTYSFELLFRFTGPSEASNGYRLITNFSNQSDRGLYLSDEGKLCLRAKNNDYSSQTCGPTVIGEGDWIHLSITRNAATEKLEIYLNGNLEFDVDIKGNDWALANNFYFFQDPSGGSLKDENGPVEISYTRLYDEALDATSITELGQTALLGDNIEIIASATDFCGGAEVELTASGGIRSYYIWSTGDTTSTETLIFTITQDTTIWVSGIAESPCDRRCFDVADTIHLKVLPTVIPVFEVSSPVCRSQEVTATYTGETDSLAAVTWIVPNAVPGFDNSSLSTTLTFTSEGTFPVTLRTEHSGSGCLRDTTINVTVNPTANTQVSRPSEICQFENARFQYIGDASGAAGFTWELLDGGVIDPNQGNDRDVYISWEDTGTKRVRLRIMEGDCESVQTFSIVVNEAPVIELDMPFTACTGDDVLISFIGTADVGATFEWSGDISGTPDDPQAAVFNWDTAGEKEITLTVTQGNCPVDSTFSLMVYQTPVASVNAPTSICSADGATIEFDGIASNAAIFLWDFDGGTVTQETTPDRLFVVEWDDPLTTPVTKTINLTINDNGCPAELEFFIEIGLTPTAEFTVDNAICTGETIRTLYTGTADPTVADFDWDFDGASSVTQVVAPQEAWDVAWDTEGTKTISLIVTLANCESIVYTQDVEVTLTPDVNYNYPNVVCNNESFLLEFAGDGGSDPNVSFIGLDGTATQQGTSLDYEIVFNQATIGATENFTVQINNDGCISSQDIAINVLFVPTMDMSFPSSACQFEAARFRYTGTADEADSDYEFTWDWDGGTATRVGGATAQRWDVVWNTDGPKTVELTINYAGCSVTETYDINVLEKPIAAVDAPAGICIDDVATIAFDEVDIPGTVYTWNWGGGNANPVTGFETYEVSWATVGVKNLSLTTTLNGCDSTINFQVEVSPLPDTNIDYPAFLCVDQPGTFVWNGTGTPPDEILWNIPDATTITNVSGDGLEIEVVFDNPETAALVEATIISGICEVDIDFTIDVFDLPDASFTAPGDCAGEDLTFTIDNHDATVTYEWVFDVAPDVFVDNTTSIDVNWNTAGDYEITLSATSAQGCVNEESVTVTVGEIPSLDFTINPIVCIDEVDILTLNDFNPAATYTLEFTDADSNPDNPDVFNFDAVTGEWELQWDSPNGGIKNGLLSVNLGGCEKDTVFSIGVYNYIDFDLSTTTACERVVITVTDNSIIEPGAEYVWDWGDGALAPEDQAVATPLADGSGWEVYWPVAGIYDIELSIVSGTGDPLVCDVISALDQVEILPGPEYTIEVDGDDDLSAIYSCKDVDMNVSITNDNIIDFPNLVISIEDADGGIVSNADFATNPATFDIQWPTVGEKNVVLRIEDPDTGCDPIFETITFFVFADPTFEVDNDNACAGDAIEFSFVGVVNTDPLATQTIQWEFLDEGGLPTRDPDDLSGLPQTADDLDGAVFTLEWSTPGFVKAILTIGGDCDDETHEVDLFIGFPPDFSYELIPDPLGACPGEDLVFNYDFIQANADGLFEWDSPASSITWQWTDSDGVEQEVVWADPFDFTTANLEDTEVTVNFTQTGTYTVTLIINNAGCIDSLDYIVTIAEEPIAGIDDAQTIFCTNSEATFVFNGTDPNPGVTTFEWEIIDINDADPLNHFVAFSGTDEDITVTFTTLGDYTVRLTLSNQGCIDVDEFDIEVIEGPDVAILADPTVCRFTPLDIAYTATHSIDDAADLVATWYFDGGIPNEDSTQVTFLEDRIYNLAIEVESTNGCITRVEQEITVTDAPPVDFDIPDVCQYNEFTITANYDSSYDPVSFSSTSTALTGISGNELSFLFGDGEEGLQDIEITISAGGCVRDTTIQVDVRPAPSMGVSAPATVCVGELIQIFYTGDGDHDTDDFTWTFDPGSNGGTNWTRNRMSDEEGYNVRFLQAGTYDITLLAERGNCSTETTFSIEVDNRPFFQQTFDPSVCVNELLDFTYTGGNNVVSLIDPSGEGIVTGGGNFYQIEWSSPGTYALELTLSNGGCEETRSFPVEVFPLPDGLINLQAEACTEEEVFVAYNGSADIFADYDWSFQGSPKVTKRAGTESYILEWESPGMYDVSLSLTEDGCTTTFTETITVNALPISDFSRPNQVCQFANATFSVLSPDSNYTYNWDFDDADIVSANADSTQVTVRWDEDGIKEVTIVADNNGCIYYRTRQIVVRNAPDATFIVDDPFCLDPNTGEATGQVTYTGTSDLSSNTFVWDFGDASAVQISSDPLVYELTYSNAGFQEITLEVISPFCGRDRGRYRLAINNLATFELSDLEGNICAGVAVEVVFTGSYELDATLNWDWGDPSATSIQTDTNPITYEVTYFDPGTKTITLDIIGAQCNDDSFDLEIEVEDRPTSSFTSDISDACSSTPIIFTFTEQFDPDQVIFWDWGGEAEVTRLTDIEWEVIYNEGGVKDITLVVQDLSGCASDTATAQVTVFDNSEASLDTDPNLCLGDVRSVELDLGFLEPEATWSWDFGDAIVTNLNADESTFDITWNTLGSRDIVLYVNGLVCPDEEVPFTFHVGEPANLAFDVPAQACMGEIVSISYNGTNDPETLSFGWDFFGENAYVNDTTAHPVEVRWDSPGIKQFRAYVNNSGCITDMLLSIEITPAVLADFDLDEAYCQHDEVVLIAPADVPANATVEWRIIDPLSDTTLSNALSYVYQLADTGRYQIRLLIDDPANCITQNTAFTHVNMTPAVDFSTPAIVCIAEPFIVRFEGEQFEGAQYFWDFGDAIYARELGSERYELAYGDLGLRQISMYVSLNGCVSEVLSREVAVIDSEGVNADESEICVDEPFTLLLDFGVDIEDVVGYAWNFDGARVLEGSGLGPYTVSWPSVGSKTVELVLEGSNCVNELVQLQVEVIPTLMPSISIDFTNYACTNADIMPEIGMQNGGDNPTVLWYINEDLIGEQLDTDAIADGDWIQAALVSDYRCVTQDTVLSNRVQARISNFVFVGELMINPNPVCIGDVATLSAGAGNYMVLFWEHSEDGVNWEDMPEVGDERQIEVSPEVDWYYRVLVSDEFGICRAYSPAGLLQVKPYNPIETSGNTTMRAGDSRILEASRGSNFSWEPAEYINGNPNTARISVSPPQTTDFIVSGLTIDGCRDVDTVRVTVTPPLIIANAFTPDGDGINDTWQIPEMEAYPQGEVYIYTRWGRRVFFSVGYSTPWDGRFNGDYLPTGVYYYVIDTKDGYPPYKGNVTLIR